MLGSRHTPCSEVTMSKAVDIRSPEQLQEVIRDIKLVMVYCECPSELRSAKSMPRAIAHAHPTSNLHAASCSFPHQLPNPRISSAQHNAFHRASCAGARACDSNRTPGILAGDWHQKPSTYVPCICLVASQPHKAPFTAQATPVIRGIAC